MNNINKFEIKVATFLSAIQNAYRDEEDREEIPQLKIEPGIDFAEDFIAMTFAQMMFYKRIMKEDIDLLGFTHILNRLANQRMVELARKDEKESIKDEE